MAYSGKFKVTNRQKYKGDPSNIVYRSMWEKHCFKWCDTSVDVAEWGSEEIVVPYYYDVDKKYHRYFVDLKIKMSNGTVYLIEIKPDKETRPPEGKRKTRQYVSEGLTYIKNMNKWEAATSYAKDRGWKFEIWTENTLRNMGIMPKAQPGKLKPLKPLAPYKRRKSI